MESRWEFRGTRTGKWLGSRHRATVQAFVVAVVAYVAIALGYLAFLGAGFAPVCPMWLNRALLNVVFGPGCVAIEWGDPIWHLVERLLTPFAPSIYWTDVGVAVSVGIGSAVGGDRSVSVSTRCSSKGRYRSRTSSW